MGSGRGQQCARKQRRFRDELLCYSSWEGRGEGCNETQRSMRNAIRDGILPLCTAMCGDSAHWTHTQSKLQRGHLSALSVQQPRRMTRCPFSLGSCPPLELHWTLGPRRGISQSLSQERATRWARQWASSSNGGNVCSSSSSAPAQSFWYPVDAPHVLSARGYGASGRVSRGAPSPSQSLNARSAPLENLDPISGMLAHLEQLR